MNQIEIFHSGTFQNLKNMFILYIFIIFLLKVFPEVIIAIFLTYSFHDKQIVKNTIKTFENYLLESKLNIRDNNIVYNNGFNNGFNNDFNNGFIIHKPERNICKGTFKNGKPCCYKTDQIYCKIHSKRLAIESLD
jgi:hypothetical protein